MVESLGQVQFGLNTICRADGKNSEAMMDIDILKLGEKETKTIFDAEKETAVLLLKGRLHMKWSDHINIIERNSEFDENPWCLHIPKGIKIELTAIRESESVIQKAENPLNFEPKLYSPQECRCEVFGDGEWGGTARRIVRTVFDYGNAPYSHMVIGEVINFPGKWSSYPPHHHPQPEVYYYRFNKQQGFGLCLNGTIPYKVGHNSYAIINGGLVHPQVAAPGYAMYYCWMIRHFENNPWKDRIVEKEHEWLTEKNIRIWPESLEGMK